MKFLLSLSLSLEVEEGPHKKIMETLIPKGIYTVLLLGLSDLSSTRFRLLNLVQNRS